MALSNIFIKCFVLKNFYKILLNYCINSHICNYGKRTVIGPPHTVLIYFLFFIF